MPFTPLTSVCIGIVWVLVCVGVGVGPEIVAVVRGLRERARRRG